MNQKCIKLPAFGNSMYPFFISGDILSIQPISLAEIKVNDFITFLQKNVFITHRVIYIPPSKKYILTKGDANHEPDKKVFPEKIIGKVMKIHRNGKTFLSDTLYHLQSLLYLKEINKVNTIFQKNNINFVFLKGLPLHLYFEKKIPQRLYADCDILIDKKDIPHCITILKKHGYSIRNPNTTVPKFLQTYPPEFDMTKTINGIPVSFDIHTEVCFMVKQFFGGMSSLYSEQLLDNLGKTFLKNKRTITLEKSHFPLLQKEDLILYLALHLFSHNLKGYHHYESLKTALTKQNIDFTILAKSIKEFQLENYVYSIFLLLEKYYHIKFPISFIKTIQPPEKIITYIKRHMLTTNIFSDEGKLTRGEEKFRHIFSLSPNTMLKKLSIIFSLPIMYSIAWVILKKVQLQFIFLKVFFHQYGGFALLKTVKKPLA
ncbi:MAG: signal peptidase I [Candidatus Levybacteria bacterium]|nr:signal peptidase I [Candidatus Levybacteria bacterium]